MAILTNAHDVSGRMGETLEQGRIVYFDRSPIALPPDVDLQFLRDEMPRLLQRKNVSLYPDSGQVVGLSDATARSRAHSILQAHSERVRAFLQRELGSLTGGWRIGTSSFRPLEEQGRKLSAHASNELIHVDAGAYGATHGGGILRFFINAHPSADRVWATKGTFATVLDRYGQAAGVRGLDLRPKWWDRARSGALAAAAKIVPAARIIDSSPYDRAMRRLHNFMKDTEAFQANNENHESFRFAPGSAWMVMTDRLSHACLSGQYALVDTFIIAQRAFLRPELSPLALLQARA